MSNKITVVMCPVDRPPYVTSISDSLKNLQKLVGGYIEAVTLTTDSVLICNEEGRIRGLPRNPSIRIMGRIGICGDCFICGVDGEEFASLDEQGKKTWLSETKAAWRSEHD